MTKPRRYVRKDGAVTYRLAGVGYHRPDGPAIVHPDGYQAYWLNGQRHRPDGPAIVWPNGTQEYWLNGQRHRPDGPAIVRPDGMQEWWLNGQQIDSYMELRMRAALLNGDEIALLSAD